MTLNRTIKFALLLLVILLLAAPGHAADDRNAIIQATMKFVKMETAIKDPVVTVKKVVDGYARVEVESSSHTADGSTVFLKLQKGKWKVLTSGTQFLPEDYKELKIPASLQ